MFAKVSVKGDDQIPLYQYLTNHPHEAIAGEVAWNFQKYLVGRDGTVLAKPRLVYYMVHKPPGVVSTARDPAGRPRVTAMLPDTAGRLFTVGRPDLRGAGAAVVTDRGQWVARPAQPRLPGDEPGGFRAGC